MALYLFSFLDRVNIGNARLYGLEEDLGLVGVQFQAAVSVLFVTYIVSGLVDIYLPGMWEEERREGRKEGGKWANIPFPHRFLRSPVIWC